MYGDEQFYRVFVGSSDVSMSTLVNIGDISTGHDDPLEGFDEFTDEVMGEPKMVTGDGKLTLTTGAKTKKCDTSFTWIGKDDVTRDKLLALEGAYKCVIFVDTRTGLLNVAHSQKLNVNADLTGNTYAKIMVTGTRDGMLTEVLKTKSLILSNSNPSL